MNQSMKTKQEIEGCGKVRSIERPILFSAPMILALLDGNKTQTRRVMTPPPLEYDGMWMWKSEAWGAVTKARIPTDMCPHGKIGDHLWVKETWVGHQRTMRGYFRADMQYWDHARNEPRTECGQPENAKWKPSIFMPRWASRITLEITGIRVQRVQEITEADSLAEGCMNAGGKGGLSAVANYSLLWNSIQLTRQKPSGAYSWANNPWVWAISFRRIKP